MDEQSTTTQDDCSSKQELASCSSFSSAQEFAPGTGYLLWQKVFPSLDRFYFADLGPVLWETSSAEDLLFINEHNQFIT